MSTRALTLAVVAGLVVSGCQLIAGIDERSIGGDASLDGLVGNDAHPGGDAADANAGGDAPAPLDSTTGPNDAQSADATSDGGVLDGGGQDGADAEGGSTKYLDTVLADSPLAYWRFGDPSGSTTAVDAKGHYPGTYVGDVTFAKPGAITSQPGDLAVYLNESGGETGYVAVDGAFSTLTEFTGASPFSLEIWIQPTKIDTEFRGVMSNELGTDAGKDGYVVYLGGFTSNGIGLGFDRWSDTSSTPLHDAGAVAQNTGWYHVVAVYDGAQMILYVNGQQSAVVASSLAIPSFACTFVIGATHCGTVASFQGLVDEAAVYTTALSPARIQAHYQAAQ
ncbi:MAG TPA: LamG domain-containing protein [Polyangiaceae bacterium]